MGVALLDPVSIVRLVFHNAGRRLGFIRIVSLEAERFEGGWPLTSIIKSNVMVLGLAVPLLRLLPRLQLRLLLLLLVLLPLPRLLLHLLALRGLGRLLLLRLLRLLRLHLSLILRLRLGHQD